MSIGKEEMRKDPTPFLSCSKNRSLMRNLHQSPNLWTSDFQIHQEVHFCGHHQSRCAHINWSSTTSNIIYLFAHLFLFIGSRVSLCSSDLSWNGCPPASAFQELGLQACATTVCSCQHFFRPHVLDNYNMNLLDFLPPHLCILAFMKVSTYFNVFALWSIRQKIALRCEATHSIPSWNFKLVSWFDSIQSPFFVFFPWFLFIIIIKKLQTLSCLLSEICGHYVLYHT